MVVTVVVGIAGGDHTGGDDNVSGGATTSNAVVLPSAGAAMGASITATNGTSSATTAHRATTPLSSSSLDSTTGSSVQHQYSQIHSRTASTDSWGSVSSGGVKHLHTGTPIAQTTSDRATTTTSANGMPSTKRQIYILCLWNILLIDLQWNRNNSLERRDDFVFFYKSMVDLNGNGHLGMRKFADINATDSNEEASCDNGVVGNASGTASSRCSTSPTVSIDFDKKPHAMSIPLIHFLVQSLLLDHDETNCNMESMQSSLNLLQTILQQDLRLYGSSPSVPSSGINSHLLSGTQCHVAHHKKEHAHYNILLIGHVLRRMQEERQLSQKELLVWTKIKKGRDSTLLIDLIEQVMYFPPWNPNHLCASLHSSRSMPPTQSSLGIHVENSTTTHERLTLFRGTENLHLRDIIAPLCDVQKLIKKYFRPDAPISGGHTRSPGSDSKRRRHISHSPGRSFHMDFPVSPLKTSPNFPSSPLSPTPFALRRASKPDPFTPRSPQVKSLLGFPSLTSSFNENSILSFGESDDDEYTMNAFNSLDDYSQDDETGARQFAQHASTHTTITVKLCLYPVKQSKLKQLKHIPPLHLTSSPQSMFGLYHSALIVGKWNLFWDPHTELIIPSYPFSYTSSRGVGAPLLALDIAEFDKEDLNSLRTIIGTQVVKWNTEFKYGTRSTISKQRKKQEKLEKKLGKQQERNMKKIAQKEKKGYLPSRHEYPMPDTPITPASGIASNGGSPVDTFVDARVSPRSGSSPPHSRSSGTADSPQDSSVRHPFAKMGNCQDFVDHMLNTLGLSLKSLDSPSLDSPVVSYFAHLSRTGKASHTFLLTDTFKQHFKIRDVHAWAASWNLHVPSANILKFKTHRDLDSFVHFLKETDPNVDKKFDGSWKLLKSFDRGFWIEYIRLHVKREQILLDSLHDPQQRAANTSKLAAIDEELKRVEPAFDSNDVLMCPFANPLDRSFCVTPNSSDDEFSDVERDGMLWKQSDNDDWMPPHHDVEKPLPAVHVIERSLEKGLLKRIDK
eukprot:CAMPEP_0117442188 /NCGR_PEP_ID=MMETSP0759-20121206/4021_1 /TAXON_ID=63605 /ORGANISM="Percolomonas cosmopolitus, Strain WS" /LENGTH=1015 /DNA_ID=CAMNT_0005234065 /DNA_START=5689 /DNA_END=8737 /DNA_ORIENTATION=+